MAKVYVGFSKRPGNLLSNLIRMFDNSDYSHVYIRRQSKYGEYVYQASGLEVNFMNINTFKGHNVIVEEYEFELSEDKMDIMLKFFIKYVGRPYSLKALFQIAWIMLCSKIGIKVKSSGDGDATFICSEMGVKFVEAILGVNVTEDENYITPKQLNPYVKKYGKRVI